MSRKSRHFTLAAVVGAAFVIAFPFTSNGQVTSSEANPPAANSGAQSAVKPAADELRTVSRSPSRAMEAVQMMQPVADELRTVSRFRSSAMPAMLMMQPAADGLRTASQSRATIPMLDANLTNSGKAVSQLRISVEKPARMPADKQSPAAKWQTKFGVK